MARCGRDCPYHWHDSECEYCGARGDAVIDLEDYDYDTCPYFQEYLDKHPEKRKAWDQAKTASGKGGCLPVLLVIAGIIILWLVFFAAPAMG